jgi:hypothetical protein
MKHAGLISLLAVVCVFCTSCGDDGNGAVSTCNALCDHQATAENCPPSTATEYVPMCKALCKSVVASLDADCKEKAVAAWECGSQTNWECSAGGNLPQQVDPTACQEVDEPYAECLQ